MPDDTATALENSRIAIAQCSALLLGVVAIIRTLPADAAQQAARQLRAASLLADAVSNAESRLSETALAEQADTLAQLVSLLEKQADRRP